MLRLYRHRYPSIVDPATGATVVVFSDTAQGWSKAFALVRS